MLKPCNCVDCSLLRLVLGFNTDLQVQCLIIYHQLSRASVGFYKIGKLVAQVPGCSVQLGDKALAKQSMAGILLIVTTAQELQGDCRVSK